MGEGEGGGITLPTTLNFLIFKMGVIIGPLYTVVEEMKFISNVKGTA